MSLITLESRSVHIRRRSCPPTSWTTGPPAPGWVLCSANYAEVEKCAQSMLQIRELRRSEKIELYVLLIASGTDELIL